MNDKRIKSRPLFRFEDLQRGVDIQRISREAVNGFGGERDYLAALQLFYSACDGCFAFVGRAGRKDLRLHFFATGCRSARAFFTRAIASSAVAPSAVRCPIFRRGRGSILP